MKLGLLAFIAILLSGASVSAAAPPQAAPTTAKAADVGSSVTAERARAALTEALAALQATPPTRAAARTALELASSPGAEPATSSQAYFRLGVLDEEDAQFARALANYRACAELAPASRWARSAHSRIVWLDQRSELDFAPLATLQRVRNNPARFQDASIAERLAVDAESFPPGLVRSEARTLVAQVWLALASRRADALRELRRIVDDPSSGAADAAFAERDLVDALIVDQKLDLAAQEVEKHHFDPKAEAKVHRLLQRRFGRRVAIGELVTALLLAAFVSYRRMRGKREARSHGIASTARLGPIAIGAILVLGSVSLLAVTFVVADATESRHLNYFGI
jgi:hypothetical protein